MTTTVYRTAQEIFDVSTKALIEQGFPSYDPDYGGTCYYRGPNGTKCAIGHLIPDDKYDPDFEGQNATPEICRAARIEFLANTTLAGGLQEAHDVWIGALGGTNIPCWANRLREIAKDYNLSTQVLDEAGL